MMMHERLVLLLAIISRRVTGFVLFQPDSSGSRRIKINFANEEELSPAEGDVILYRLGEEDTQLKVGLVVAEMHCTQWVQPLVAQEPLDAGEIVFFEDAQVDTAIQIQGTAVAVIESLYGQLPVPQLGGGVGYGSPAVDCYTVNAAELDYFLENYQVELKVTESGIAPWTH
uniref:Uncharacterized protein n=1 Tax=Aureoumbra lagunensis TaxID=44058 RepID=A0A7S3JVJ3_9STRA|mmetsp:Transcript_13949/g.20969  ORF Transcript_13949/g.20969 Transcript_13949/m.20969 type:complete len:171 (-) Transcript_13949:32-544(-)